MRAIAMVTGYGADRSTVATAAGRMILCCAGLLVGSPVLGACGDDTVAPRTSPVDDHAFLVAAPGDRVVVAEVDGVPIYDDCVARQAATHQGDRQAALDDCIGFELLAQEAQRRGFRDHPAVIRTGKDERVRRLMDEHIADRFPDPEGTDRAILQALYDRVRDQRYYHPVFRTAVHARAPARKKEEGTPRDLAARALADEIHRALADRRGLTAQAFREAATEIAGERTIELGEEFAFPRRPTPRSKGAVESYAAATFAIPEVGQISPPTRTRWGWDVILLVAIRPEIDTPLDDVKEELFVYSRRETYVHWVKGLLERASIKRFPDALAAWQAISDGQPVPGTSAPGERGAP